MKVRIYVTPKAGVLDPAGRAVEHSLHALGFDDARGVRLGKYIEMEIGGERHDAEERVERMCRQLLANAVIEEYRFEVED